jgi:DNA-binding MarR family transcriptional regulator
MASKDDRELLTRWHGLLERHARATSALERALAEHELGVSEFEVLDRLAAADEQDCRMQTLADDIHLSQSALSRVVGRLEEQGLVTRAICRDDRRGIYATITEEGRTRWAAAQPVHRAVLSAVLGDLR